MVDTRAGNVERVMELERVRVAEVETVQPFGHDDRVAPVRREVHVVRIVDRNRPPRLAGARIDRRQRVALVVRDVERLQVPRRDDMLREDAHAEVLDDLERPLVDHVDRVAVAVRHVDQRLRELRDRAEVARAIGGVDVLHDDGRGRAGLRRRHEARDLGARARRVASAGEEDAFLRRDGGEVRERLGQRADDPRSARPRPRRAGRSACRPSRRGRRSRRRPTRSPPLRRASSAPGAARCARRARAGRPRVDGVARRAGLERAAGDHEPPAAAVTAA